MARDHIYRNVDVRALAHFHNGEGGISVNAERVWCRLLIDEITTPVPGLVLVHRGELADRCRMTLKVFDAAFAELAGTRDEDGSPAPMAIANWPLGVVVLPSAPRQPVHRPNSTAKPVQWAQFMERDVRKCPEVDALRQAWRETLREMQEESIALGKPVGWLTAFDEQSRGRYAKRSAKGSANNSPKTSANGSGNVSAGNSAGDSQESGVRSQEEKPPSPPASARGSTNGRPPYDAGAFEADAWRILGRGLGAAGDAVELLATVQRAAEARGKTAFDFAEPFLAAVKELGDDLRARGVHHGGLTAADVLRGPPTKPGGYLAQVLDLADGKRMGDPGRAQPATPTIRLLTRPAT